MLEAIAALFIVGGLWFWISISITFCIILAFAENERNWFAGATLVGFLFAINYFNPELFTLSIGSIVGWTAVYLAAGAVWSVVKWFSYLHKRADKFETLKLEWIELYNKHMVTSGFDKLVVAIKTEITDNVPDEALNNFKAKLQGGGFLRKGETDIIPNWRDKKDKLTSWILWWPTSALWTVLNDPLVRLANWIYKRLGNVYDKMANSVFNKIGVSDSGKL